jgi:hypothetical protein
LTDRDQSPENRISGNWLVSFFFCYFVFIMIFGCFPLL